MRRESALALSAAGIALAMLLVAVVAPGALAEDDRPKAASELSIEEVTVGSERVGGETATLSINLYLRHTGAKSQNVDVVLRATGKSTGLVENTTELGVSEIDGDRELEVSGQITLERDTDYELEALIYENDRRIATRRAALRGLGTLKPAYADASLEFYEFTAADLPSVSYTVDEVGREATLDLSAYLTNNGDKPAGDVEVELTARQTDSNIVADRERVTVGTVEPGRTTTPSAKLTVPDGYNYYLDAVIWRDGVIVDTVREAATLAPNGTAPTIDDSGASDDAVNLGDFDSGDDFGDNDGAEPDEGSSGTGSGGQPGFGPFAALVALVFGALAASRIGSTSNAEETDQ
jgi:hypothetical protein